MKTMTLVPVALAGAFCTIALANGDAQRGREGFEKTCSGCHALDHAKEGPPLRNVYNRAAGKDAEFSYSDAMKRAAIVWDDATLDRWLTDTESVVPGNDMAFRLNDASRRSDIIAYLKQLSGK